MRLPIVESDRVESDRVENDRVKNDMVATDRVATDVPDQWRGGSQAPLERARTKAPPERA